MVTGKNVADGSLTGRDVKNSSLGSKKIKDGDLLAKDFKAGQLPAGAQGAPGPQGAAGADGSAGAAGPSDIYVVGNANEALDTTGGSTEVASVTVPAGSYLLGANLWMTKTETGTSTVRCDLESANTPPRTRWDSLARIAAHGRLQPLEHVARRSGHIRGRSGREGVLRRRPPGDKRRERPALGDQDGEPARDPATAQRLGAPARTDVGSLSKGYLPLIKEKPQSAGDSGRSFMRSSEVLHTGLVLVLLLLLVPAASAQIPPTVIAGTGEADHGRRLARRRRTRDRGAVQHRRRARLGRRRKHPHRGRAGRPHPAHLAVGQHPHERLIRRGRRPGRRHQHRVVPERAVRAAQLPRRRRGRRHRRGLVPGVQPLQPASGSTRTPWSRST